MSKWPMVKLGEVLRHRKEFVVIDDSQSYKRCRVQLHAQGVVLRDQVAGAEIKTKKQQVCKSNEFLVAEIDAKLGGYGIVPPVLEGALVSSHYFLFGIDESRLERRFLDYFIRTPGFFEQVAAQGSTNYAAIRPAHVLGYTMPLPPLAEQRRLVGRIDALASRIEEAKRLREESDKLASRLFSRQAMVVLTRNKWPVLPLQDLLMESSRNGLAVKPKDERSGIPILRISAVTSRSDATVEESDCKYLDVTARELDTYRLKPGDLLACRFNGNLHFVGRFAVYQGNQMINMVYPDKLIRFRVDKALALPQYVRYAMNSPTIRQVIESFCATTAGNVGISATDLKTVPVPIPPLDEQSRIVNHLDRLIGSIQQMVDQEVASNHRLAALIPAILDRAFRGDL